MSVILTVLSRASCIFPCDSPLTPWDSKFQIECGPPGLGIHLLWPKMVSCLEEEWPNKLCVRGSQKRFDERHVNESKTHGLCSLEHPCDFNRNEFVPKHFVLLNFVWTPTLTMMPGRGGAQPGIFKLVLWILLGLVTSFLFEDFCEGSAQMSPLSASQPSLSSNGCFPPTQKCSGKRVCYTFLGKACSPNLALKNQNYPHLLPTSF